MCPNYSSYSCMLSFIISMPKMSYIDFKVLILLVNIAGMTTLIASLASIIYYKIYTSEFENNNYSSLTLKS